MGFSKASPAEAFLAFPVEACLVGVYLVAFLPIHLAGFVVLVAFLPSHPVEVADSDRDSLVYLVQLEGEVDLCFILA